MSRGLNQLATCVAMTALERVVVVCIMIKLIAALLLLVNCEAVDPDQNRLVPELVESRGFVCETHYVTTKDGYILTVHRVVNPKHKHHHFFNKLKVVS